MSLELFLRSLGKKIASHRRTIPLTQKDTAARTGISYRYYQSIETGEANITLGTLWRIAQCLDAHPEDLFPSRADFS